MRALFGFLLFTALSLPTFAAYDSSWYQGDFWSGEYPIGFSVIRSGVVVPARASMDLAVEKNIACRLPKRAVYHPWNTVRKATYRTASKIVKFTAKENFALGAATAEGGPRVMVKKGEALEYLMYAAEGIFTVRYNGAIYSADQSLFAAVEDFDSTQFREDAWLQVRCRHGKKAWIYMGDILAVGDDGNPRYLPGLDSWSRGLHGYGDVRDLSK